MIQKDTYSMGMNNLSVPEFQDHVGLGMFGGVNGTYGNYSVGPQVDPTDFKQNRERQSE
jgi:hypothetical protein